MLQRKIIYLGDHTFLGLQSQVETSKGVVNTLKQHYKEVIIAGGAPRNWWFNSLARDVDIFVYDENEYGVFDLLVCRDNLQRILGIPVLYKGDPDYDIQQRQGLLFVFEAVINGTTVQIMIHNSPVMEVYKTFPISLSRYFVDFIRTNNTAMPCLILARTNLATLSEANSKIYCKEIEFSKSQIKYLKKIWSYYPEYSVVSDSEGADDFKDKYGIEAELGNLV